jgi:inosine triphosphate pyrophosphatase
MQIHYATANKDKFHEASLILESASIELINSPLKLPEIQGTHQEVAISKVIQAYQKLEKPVIVDDVAFHCSALNGLPGPYIKQFLELLGSKGMWEMISHYNNHSCRAVCIIAYMDHAMSRPKLFEGSLSGKVVPPRGSSMLHGETSWNALFEPDGMKKTFAELTMEEISKISPRQKALTKLKAYIEQIVRT